MGNPLEHEEPIRVGERREGGFLDINELVDDGERHVVSEGAQDAARVQGNAKSAQRLVEAEGDAGESALEGVAGVVSRELLLEQEQLEQGRGSLAVY